ncbi:MAG: helix-turn-helix transcriptional regulator [Acidobacteria bacterium]|nr:helix-turn-helix transcriptional regulator [Acidobacteriota bacterium]
MTTWSEFKRKRPLEGEAKRAYEAARQKMGVGYLILKARAEAGLTQAQLAKRIGTSQPMIARWESGAQVPSVTSLLRIAEATGFDLAVALQKPGSTKREFQVISSHRSGTGRPARSTPARRRAG